MRSVFDVIEGGPFPSNHRKMRDLELVRLAAAALQRASEAVAHVVVHHADVGAEVELCVCVEGGDDISDRGTQRNTRREWVVCGWWWWCVGHRISVHTKDPREKVDYVSARRAAAAVVKGERW